MKKISIVDKEFFNYTGHSYEYNKSVSGVLKKKGVIVTVFTSNRILPEIQAELPIVPFFGTGKYRKLSSLPLLGRFLAGLAEYIELFRLQDKETVIFIPNIFYFKRLISIAIAYLFVSPACKKVIFLYRFSTRSHTGSTFFFRSLHFILRRHVRKGKIIFTTDSEIIASDTLADIGDVLTVLPIPHIHAAGSKSEITNGKIHVYLPGEARIDKGIDIVLEAIHVLSGHTAVKDFVFIFQFSDGYDKNDVMRAKHLSRIESLRKHVEIQVHGHLSSYTYYQVMYDADIILLPYRVKTQGNVEGYYARTSGIFAEAVAAGKPVITTKPTWMSYQLNKMQSGICIDDRSPSQLAAALLTMKEHFDEYRTAAVSASRKWVNLHNPSAFCEQFIHLVEK